MTAEQLAERGGAALLQEKYRQELETLENLLERLGAGTPRTGRKARCIPAMKSGREMLYGKHYQAMESLFLDAQAGILAEKLTEGEAMPGLRRYSSSAACQTSRTYAG